MAGKKPHDTAGSLITRRTMISRAAGAAAGGVLASIVPRPARAAAGDGRPNIIFILADNMRWDCAGFMGHPFIKTPGIDRLAAEGVVFDNAFNTTALCSPSRASILTGTYAHTHGVLNNHTPWTGRQPIFFDYLKKAGYDNAFIGKWHMPGRGLPKIPSLDLFASYTYREGQGSYFNCPFIVNGKPEPPGRSYITADTTDRAIAFMERRRTGRGARRPFCLYVSHRPAHPPYRAPRDITGMYDRSPVTMPEAVDSWFSRTNGNVFQGIMMGSYENQYRRYCETITAMDRDILRLLDWLDREGLRDTTAVIFMSDNGCIWGEHRYHGIKYPYEESIRLPLIVRYPGTGVRPGARRSQMVLNMDIAPTILDLAGVAVPGGMEGRSMGPFLDNGGLPGRRAWLLEYWKYFPENFPTYAGVRTATHKYIEYEKTLKPELFDLKNDPRERRNLYGTPEGDALLPGLKSMLAQLKSGKRFD